MSIIFKFLFIFIVAVSVILFFKKEIKKKNTVNSVLNDSKKLKTLKEAIDNSEKEEAAIRRICSILNVSTDISIEIYEKITNKQSR